MDNFLDRRVFIKQLSTVIACSMGGIAGAATAKAVDDTFLQDAQPANPNNSSNNNNVPTPDKLPVIKLGRTGRIIPRLGFGGFAACSIKSPEDAVKIISKAIELGVRYFDTAPSYCIGESEKRIGKALNESGIARENFYVATKTIIRDADGARRELEESLTRLNMEYVDSVQIHSVHKDYQSMFGENAVIKGLEKAKAEGLIKHIGITAHANPSYLIKAVRKYEFDTALVPVNPWDTKHMSFVNEFLPVAVELGIAVIAMKVYAGGALFKDKDKFQPEELLQYALSQPGVAVIVPGCDKIEYMQQAYKAVSEYKTVMSDELQAELIERTGGHLGKKTEWYKDD